MTIIDLLGPAALVSVAIWLSKNWIAKRLSSDIQLENDAKLEEIRSDLKHTKDKLSDIASAGNQAYATVHAGLLPHKIEAINAIWSSTLKWNEMSTVSMYVCVLSDEWIRENGSHPNTVKSFKDMLKPPNDMAFVKERNSVESYRPFVSNRIWALYSAYNSFYASRIIRAGLLTMPDIDHIGIFSKIDERGLVKESATQEILKLYDANIIDGTNSYLKFLSEELINEFEAELSGKKDSNRAAINAKEILNAADNLLDSVSKRTTSLK